MSTLCAVGDSFVFGAELVTTYHKDAFAGVSDHDYCQLEFHVSENKEWQTKYDAYLNDLRFTSLVAKNLAMDHISYAQGGSSQEGIKLQAQLLMSQLKAQGTDPADTTWIVGVTAPTRQMFIAEKLDHFHEYLARFSNSNYQWSRYTVETIYADRMQQSHALFSEPVLKEYIATLPITNAMIQWAMHICDVANLLRANKVRKVCFVNFFQHLMPVDPVVTKLVNQMLRDNNVSILSSYQVPITHTLQMFDSKYFCQYRHLSQEGNEVVAAFITDYFKGKNESR